MASSLSNAQHKLSAYAVIIFTACLFAGISLRPESAHGCGGPAGYDLATPMYSLDSLLALLTTTEDPYEVVTRDEFLFLYPFRLEKRPGIEPLWTFAYTGSGPAYLPPSTDLLESALNKNDWKAADAEAKKIVNQVLDMPSVVADGYQSQLIKALEFLEIQPLFQKTSPELIRSALWDSSIVRDSDKLPGELQDVLAMRSLDRRKVDETIKARPRHPRMGTLRFVSIRNEFARTIPDGWVYDIQKKVNKEVWRKLERSVDLWLKEFPQHPLADLVLLWKARIYYFEGDTTRAWRHLLSIYPHRQPRVLHEMRYMLMHVAPPALDFNLIKDPVLLTALLPSLKITQEQWSRLWKLSELHSSRPWAANLQERLLEKSISDARQGRQPSSYPAEPRNPTPLWGKLRALSLMEMGRWDDARKQLFSLAPDKEQALLAAAYHIRRGKPALAVQVIDLPEHIRHYLIRVMLADAELQSLMTVKSTTVRQDTLLEKGIRLAEQGKWAEAADSIKTIDPRRSKLWHQAAALNRDSSAAGRLKWARFLKEHNGKLFYGIDNAWYRSVSWRDRRLSVAEQQNQQRKSGVAGKKNGATGNEDGRPSPSNALPWTARQEQDAISGHLTRTSEMWLALQVYADLLSTAEVSKEMTTIVKEADICYNWLINWDSTNSDFWKDFLRDHSIVQQLREAGRKAKKA